MGEGNILLIDGPRQKALRRALDPSLRPRQVEQRAVPMIAPLVDDYLGRIREPRRAPISWPSTSSRSRCAAWRWCWAWPRSTTTRCGDGSPRWRSARPTSRTIPRRIGSAWPRAPRSRPGSNRSCGGCSQSRTGRPISDMLQAAEGTFEQRVAWIMPSIKIIITGGMQEPGHSAGSTVLRPAHQPRSQAAELAADPGRTGTPGGGGRAALDLADRHPDAAGDARHRAGRDRRAGRGQHRAAGVVGEPGSRRCGAQTLDLYDLHRRKRPHAAFGFGPHFCPRPSPGPDAGTARDPGVVRALPEPAARSRAAAAAARLGVSRARSSARARGIT